MVTRVVAFVLALALASCSAPHTTSRVAAPSPVRTSAKPATPRAGGRVTPPPVRMFAGVQSAVAAATQYCAGGSCAGGGGAPRVSAPEGSVVTFAVEPAPDQAVVDVTGAGAGHVALVTGTLMAFPGHLAPGAHRLTLQLRWRNATGTWAFDLVVTPPS